MDFLVDPAKFNLKVGDRVTFFKGSRAVNLELDKTTLRIEGF
jgi:hypothetical protein